MKFSRNTARFISIILQPYLMTLYSVLLLFTYTSFFDIYIRNSYIIISSVLLFSYVMPSIFTVLLKKLKYINHYYLPTKEERILPYMMAIFSNGMLVYYFYTLNIHFWFIALISAPLICLFIGFIINFFWKISTHMIGIGSLIGGVLGTCLLVKGMNPFILFIILFILAGCLGVSRLYLKRNTPAQIYVGFFTGLIASFSTIWLSLVLIR